MCSGLGCLCSFCENIKYQCTSVHDLSFEKGLKYIYLFSGEIIVEYNEIYIIIDDVFTDFFCLTFSNKCTIVRMRKLLNKSLECHSSCRFCKESKFIQIII